MDSTTMTLLVALLLVVGSTTAALNHDGAKCGEKHCSTIEYCSSYDKSCKPCSSICNKTARNYLPQECFSDCQVYLHDERYVLLNEYEELRGEVGRLWILVSISITIACVSFLLTLYLMFARKLTRWEKMRAAIRRSFASKKIKRMSSNNSDNSVGKTNNNNNDRNRATLQDAELGTSKQNGLKLTMPTISASVAPSRYSENETRHGNGSSAGSGSGSGTAVSNVTPNTTSTSLSRRHPSEDTTLDYAYDNPAMTPSPESVQLRTKRESSF